MKFRSAAVPLLLALAACGGGGQPAENHAEAEAGHGEEGVITLTAQQIATAGIEIVSPTIGGNGAVVIADDAGGYAVLWDSDPRLQ